MTYSAVRVLQTTEITEIVTTQMSQHTIFVFVTDNWLY